MYQIASGENLILASSSPRRKELLSGVGLKFTVQPSDIDEAIRPGESPEAVVKRLSFEKAALIADTNSQAWVLGADTIVVIDNEILGKPLDKADALRMVNKIQGRVHHVWGGFSIINSKKRIVYQEQHRSEVVIKHLAPGEIRAYVENGESMDKAGAYAVQGVGCSFIKEVRGSYSNVVGLPLAECLTAFQKFGLVQAR